MSLPREQPSFGWRTDIADYEFLAERPSPGHCFFNGMTMATMKVGNQLSLVVFLVVASTVVVLVGVPPISLSQVFVDPIEGDTREFVSRQSLY